MNSMLSNAAEEALPTLKEALDKYERKPRVAHKRRCVEAIARDEDGSAVRVLNFSRCCGARLFAGWHDFDGSQWLVRYYATTAGDALVIEECPVCGRSLWETVGGHRRTTVLTGLDMERLQMGARERMIAGGALDAEVVVALTADLDGEASFEEVAASYGRAGQQLEKELAAWLEAKAAEATS